MGAVRSCHCFSADEMADLKSQPNGDDRTLIDELLAEQRALTAVTQFAQRHENHELPQQARYYRDLIPLTTPKAGQQYAFEVDLDQCSGCKACVTACHSLNGLDENETWRSVGLLHGGTMAEPVQQTITTACHHCVDPACLNGCPVNAYEKDPITGIVRHLDDQCIGCQYCILKCPYDVPQYHEKKGIVRKCDMCSNRLAVGEAPACVQACPNEAIRITFVDKENIALEFREQTQTSNAFLPHSPKPDYTLPTTRYKTSNPAPANMRSGDFHKTKPEPPHLPLVFMLVLTQLSVGTLFFDLGLSLILPAKLTAQLSPMHSLIALSVAVVALTASILHLGRPLYAWRAFVGLRKSWLSREIVVFGLFAPLAALYASSFWVNTLRSWQKELSLAVVVTGLLGVFCSVMIYHDTRRIFWRGMNSAGKFFGSTVLLGAATILCTSTIALRWTTDIATAQPLPNIIAAVCALLVVTTIVKLAWEFSVLAHRKDIELSPVKRTALILMGKLKQSTIMRFAFGICGGLFCPGILLAFHVAKIIQSPSLLMLIVAGLGLGFLLLGELLERYLYFRAVVAPKMPGGFAA